MTLRLQNFRLIGAGFLLAALLACVQREDASPSASAASDSEGWASVKQCVNDTLGRIKPDVVTNALVYETTQVCYTHLHGQGLLNDFKLRRLKFIQQAYDERVLLWMVVVITLSGVALAGVQMMASFKLASGGKGTFDHAGELSIEQSKLSLKSSVTGLFILICSFAFFWVFVYEIFVIKEVDVDGKKKGDVEARAIQSGPFVPKTGPASTPQAQKEAPVAGPTPP